MKTSTKKLITTKSGSVNKNILNMLMNCRFDSKQNKIYTGYYSGSGRFTTAHSAMHIVEMILKSQGYKFQKGNDAPQGGIKGEFVKVSKIAFDLIQNIK